MPSTHRHSETHRSHATGWLRAAVLGANDGIVSTACLILGVAASDAVQATVVKAGFAALVAGAVSMAVGEYVSVSSQRDSEQADIAKEKMELATVPERELDELTGIYVKKGLSRPLARQVAEELSKGDVLAVHLREELGISEESLARPFQAAWSSAAAFAVGSLIPLVAVIVAPEALRIALTIAVAIVALGVLGFTGARVGGAEVRRPVTRVLVGSTLAMIFTLLVGKLVGTAVA